MSTVGFVLVIVAAVVALKALGGLSSGGTAQAAGGVTGSGAGTNAATATTTGGGSTQPESDVRDAIRHWTQTHAAEFGTDPNTLFVIEYGIHQQEGNGINAQSGATGPFQLLGDLLNQASNAFSANNSLDVLAYNGRVQQAVDAYTANGGGESGLIAAFRIQQRAGPEETQAAIAAGNFRRWYENALMALGQ